MSPAAMVAETPAAVGDIAGLRGDGVDEEIAELGVPAQHQGNKSVTATPSVVTKVPLMTKRASWVKAACFSASSERNFI